MAYGDTASAYGRGEANGGGWGPSRGLMGGNAPGFSVGNWTAAPNYSPASNLQRMMMTAIERGTQSDPRNNAVAGLFGFNPGGAGGGALGGPGPARQPMSPAAAPPPVPPYAPPPGPATYPISIFKKYNDKADLLRLLSGGQYPGSVSVNYPDNVNGLYGPRVPSNWSSVSMNSASNIGANPRFGSNIGAGLGSF